MAAPSGTVWGSIQGSYGKIGLYVNKSSTDTKTSVTVEVWFWSKYSVSDTVNTLYYDCKSSTGSATTSRGSLSVQTTVATGSGWSTSNQVKLKTYTYSYTRGTSAFNRYVYAKLADIDRVGSTMSVSTTFSVPALTSYSVKYNANDGTGAPSAQTKYYGKSLTLSSTKPTRTGYSFQGWSTANDSSVEYAAGASYTANAAATLYAVWKANTYSVKFDANGGTGAPSAQTKTYGITLKLSATKPTRTNYNFLGWSTSKTATTATYAAGGNYTSNSGTILYAVWELAYVRPRITNLSGARCVVTDEGNIISEEGTSAHIKFNYACDQALKSILIEWESVNNSGSKSLDYSETSTMGIVDTVIGDGELSVEYTYTIRITVTDANGYTSVTTTLSGLLLAIDVLPENAGISFGKPAELKDHADFNYTIYPRKGFKNVPIEEDTDLHTLTTPNTYVSQDKVASSYINCPVSGGTFKMEVTSGGMEGQVHQTITYTSKTDFKIYHCQYHSGSWGDWKCIYSLSGNILWDCATTTNGTGWYMTASHTCNLTQKISDQPHGIVLIFALYADGEAKNEQIVEYTIHKASVDQMPGGGHSIPLLTPWKNAVKYLYINDTTVTGNEKNNQTITVGGITYTNNAFTLRYIIGF